MPFDKILVPVDGSEGGWHAAKVGSELGKRLGVAVQFIYVVPMTAESSMALSHLTKAEVEKIHQQQADNVFAQAQDVLGETIADDDRLIEVGDAATEIIDHIDEDPSSLVIMGRRGLSPMKSLLMGSVSDKVMRHGGSAVMVVG